MIGQQTLVDIPRDVALTWQEDAVGVLEDLLVHCLEEGWPNKSDQEVRHEREGLRDQAIDLLFRAGRL